MPTELIDFMLIPPWSDEEIEQLWKQQPLNNVAQLPAAESIEDTQCQ